MAKDWIQRRNGHFQLQARVFSSMIAADPEMYGIDPGDAAQLAAHYADFDAKFRAAFNPSTRTANDVLARDQARQTLTKLMRALAARIRANPAVTSGMRIGLTITVDGWAEPAPQHAPRSRPWITIRSLINNRLTLSLKDSDSSTRGIPRYCAGAQIFMFAGENKVAPADICQWRLAGITSKAKATISLPNLPPGSPVTLAARWYNTHGPGPTSGVVETWVGRMITLPSVQAA